MHCMTHLDTLTHAPNTTDAPPAARLRRVIRFDAALCVASGAALLGGAGPLADLADVDGEGTILAAGAFLVVLAAALAWLSRAPVDVLVRLTPWSADGDFVWALGSVALAVTVSMSGAGRGLLVAQALAVAGVGVLKLVAHRTARAGIIGAR